MRPGCHRIPGVRDSKTLSAAQRERLAPLIRARAVAVGVGAASVREIDQLNIYHATHLAMRRAIARVGGHEHVLVDGNRIAGFEAPGRAVHEHRRRRRQGLLDRLRVGRRQGRARPDDGPARARAIPGYGWERNQGYATHEHRDAIRALGLTPFHRRSFLALQRTLAGDQLDFDLLGDPAASPETHDLLERELVPVMADDAALDAARPGRRSRSSAGKRLRGRRERRYVPGERRDASIARHGSRAAVRRRTPRPAGRRCGREPGRRRG